jgi:TRAP-type uncharacterized transport system substrate-binding protein
MWTCLNRGSAYLVRGRGLVAIGEAMVARIAKRVVWIVMLAALLAAIVWTVARFAGPAPDGKIVIATGGSAGNYNALAETWRAELARNGIEAELRTSAEGFGTLRALLDPNSGIDAGFIKGGLVGSLQGRLASAKAKDWHERELGNLRSLGRLFYEPIWVFTRGDLPIESLRDLKDKRILVGTRQSGARRVAFQLLKANGVQRENATLVDEELASDAAPLLAHEADAAILILPADADKIQQLLRVPGIRLMNFQPEADAYTTRFPALGKVVLRRGAVEFEPLIPSAHITLLTTTTALVVRADIHPAVAALLTHTIINRPKSPFDKAGDPVLFHKPGEFPSGNDPEFELPNEARQIYKTGELPFLLRVLAPVNRDLGLPFSFTAFANAHGAQTALLLIPMLTILVPLMRLGPVFYSWSIRRRLLYWYRQLKALEQRLDMLRPADDPSVYRADIERIDAGVRRIRVPLAFSDQLYDLRGHIDFVRQRLASHAAPLKVAAE